MNEYHTLAISRAASNPHLAAIKSAIRDGTHGLIGQDLIDLLSQCLDNAYAHGFAEGALDAVTRARESLGENPFKERRHVQRSVIAPIESSTDGRPLKPGQ